MDITNITFDELAIADGIEVSRLVTARDVELFAVVSGDHNPLHLDPEYAATTQFGECIGHGMLIGAFVSAVIGLEFMGPGTVYLGQNLEFRSPIFLGDTLSIGLTVTDNHARTLADLGVTATEGATLDTTISGELTMHGVTNPVSFEIAAKIEGNRLGVIGTIPITFVDYDIVDPSITGITVKPEGVIEFVLVFSRQ